MKRSKFNQICKRLGHTSHVVQWGNADVWKIGGKIFAIGSRWGQNIENVDVKISFKCSQLSYDLLVQQPGIIPAPYLARAKWVQLEAEDALSDEEVILYIHNAYQLVAEKLPKAKKVELGFLPKIQK